jgi:hypothetical protein
VSNHCSECRADDDSPHYPECSSYRPPTQQDLADRDERIAELERQVEGSVKVCRNCKHWGGPDLSEAGPQTCQRIEYHREAEHGCGEPAALSACCPEEAGELITEADFGCVLFEAKEET